MKKRYISPCVKEKIPVLHQLMGNSIPSNGEQGAPPYGTGGNGSDGEGGWGGFGSKQVNVWDDDF